VSGFSRTVPALLSREGPPEGGHYVLVEVAGQRGSVGPYRVWGGPSVRNVTRISTTEDADKRTEDTEKTLEEKLFVKP
jgi:hypothetical protein